MTMMIAECVSYNYGTQAQKWSDFQLPPTSGGRHGTGFLPVWSGAAPGPKNYLGHTVPAAMEDDCFILGMVINPSYIGASAKFIPLFTFLSDTNTTVHVCVGLDYVDRKIKAYRGYDAGNVGATEPNPANLIVESAPLAVLSTLSYYSVEAKVRLSDTGSIQVRWDERDVINGTFDTKNGGTKTVFDTFRFHSGRQNGNGDANHAVTDIYANNEQGTRNNDFEGAVSVLEAMPNGAGSFTQYANNGIHPTNWEHVNSNSTGDYVYSDVVNNRDSYAFQNLTGATFLVALGNPPIAGSWQVRAVSVNAYAQKSDAGDRSIKLSTTSGGQDAFSPPFLLLSNLLHTYYHIFEARPNGSAWTIADFDAAEFGHQVA